MEKSLGQLLGKEGEKGKMILIRVAIRIALAICFLWLTYGIVYGICNYKKQAGENFQKVWSDYPLTHKFYEFMICSTSLFICLVLLSFAVFVIFKIVKVLLLI